jgi:hypothetical protein
MLSNDVIEGYVMDGCFCFSMLVISFHFGAVCNSMPYLCNFLYCLVSCTARNLIWHGILYSTGSHTPWDLIQHVILYNVLILDTQRQHKNKKTSNN